MNSCLYRCTVMHHRLTPREHQFHYRIFMLALDLDELASLEKKLHWFSWNRWNLYAFYDRDHWQQGAVTTKENVLRWVQQEGVAGEFGRVVLVTLPRMLGYIFSPVAFYFCYRPDGSPACAVAEVGNTFGEMKAYLIDQPRPGSGFARRVPKHFYVSPFFALDLHFDFQLPLPGETLALRVDDYEGDRPVLRTIMTGQRRPLTDGELLRQTLLCPLVTLKVIGGIHWEAFRLWLKRLPWQRKAANPHLQQKLQRPHRSLTAAQPQPAGLVP